MPINQGFLPEFDHEMATTRRFLERVPENKFDWAPHPKSMKLGALAGHLAHMPGWTKETLEKDVLDVAPGGKSMEMPKTSNRQELLALFDKNVAAGRAALAAANDDAHWMKPWALQANGQTMFSMPRVAVMRNFVLNHSIHHRAQLGVYLRLNDIPVPATYGPSADEQKF
ncbi:MAG TPA: DinB family protein [Candidatus Acidoferrales bacterium]|nr:DinB family protein [Candidatus Acidoferrales bacterium]